MISIKEDETLHGVTMTDPEPDVVHELMFNPREFDLEIPTEILFISINNIIVKIEFPIEYLNDEFIVEVNEKQFKGNFIINYDFKSPTVLS